MTRKEKTAHFKKVCNKYAFAIHEEYEAYKNEPHGIYDKTLWHDFAYEANINFDDNSWNGISVKTVLKDTVKITADNGITINGW